MVTKVVIFQVSYFNSLSNLNSDSKLDSTSDIHWNIWNWNMQMLQFACGCSLSYLEADQHSCTIFLLIAKSGPQCSDRHAHRMLNKRGKFWHLKAFSNNAPKRQIIVIQAKGNKKSSKITSIIPGSGGITFHHLC